MCGIAGFLKPGADESAAALATAAERMRDTMAHRGPDDAGVWVDESCGMTLAHRRLSVIDLTPDGHQPMHSSSGRFVVVFNGEIYNFGDLRRSLELKGHVFRGTSDTSVMLEAFEEWGVRASLEKLNGMFAFAAWDRRERELWLARDRFGEKPLHYVWVRGVLVFASELKALLAYPGLNPEIDRGSLSLYMRYNYVPCPFTIYRGVSKLPPGTFLRVRGDGSSRPEPARYWSAQQAAQDGLSRPWTGSRVDAVEELDHGLRKAVGLRMVSDVPVGAFLSGGVDSSTVAALMQKESSRPVRTFTVGFAEDGYSEARHAAAVAAHLGTDHHELLLTRAEAQAAIPRLAAIYDEPYGDSSQIPTLLVSQFARTEVTVALSGDGGDEVFGGYSRYFLGSRLWRRMCRIPLPLRRAAAGALGRMSSGALDRLLSFGRAGFDEYGRPGSVGDKAHKLSEALPAKTPADMYRLLVSQWKDPDRVVLDGREPPGAGSQLALPVGADIASRMMLADAVSYLPDDILVKLDRASMAVSLEGRIPLLDHTLFEFAWRLPVEYKLADGRGKAILRDVLYRYVPREMIERPKMGFGIPVGDWLRGGLRSWAEDLLGETRLRREGYLNPGEVRSVWSEHLCGRRDRGYQLWGVLMFEAWLDEWRGRH